ncbi:MAG: hypothetical protein HZC40_23130 [Chloroflexi bacterium]|nr:hypothetical protein [Chloroflexota bacterium]
MKKRIKNPIRRDNKPPIADDPAMRIIGLGRSGKRDLSVNHDHYIVNALRKKRIE